MRRVAPTTSPTPLPPRVASPRYPPRCLATHSSVPSCHHLSRHATSLPVRVEPPLYNSCCTKVAPRFPRSECLTASLLSLSSSSSFQQPPATDTVYGFLPERPAMLHDATYSVIWTYKTIASAAGLISLFPSLASLLRRSRSLLLLRNSIQPTLLSLMLHGRQSSVASTAPEST